MQIRISKRLAITIASVTVAGLGATAFLLVGPPKLLAKSESANFCASCHVMEEQYTAWQHAGAHSRIQCVDCHLPNGNKVEHYLWKSIDGLKDVVRFHTGRVPETIALSAHGEGVVQANCVRCHEETVARMDTGRECWGCHRRVSHRLGGTVASEL